MKINILILCLSIFALASCSNADESVYSCDPTVNSWVISNLKLIQSMKRSEWLNLDRTKQKAAIIAFTPDEKYIFWLEKLNEVMVLNWKADEKTHILELYNWVYQNPNLFEIDNTNSTEYEDFEKFMYLWSETAKKSFGWNSKILSAIAVDGNRMIDINGKMEKRVILRSNMRLKAATEIAPGTGKTCECNTRHSFCDEIYTGCSDYSVSKCNYKSSGCGWLTLEPCNGYCN